MCPVPTTKSLSATVKAETRTRFKHLTRHLLFIFILMSFFSQGAAVTLSGKVINSETGSPLPKVKILFTGLPSVGVGVAITDEQGRFQIDLESGPYEMTVSGIGFGLLKKSIQLDSSTLELEILLSPGTSISNQITVTADIEESPAELTATEIDKLKSVLMDDSIRALQHLPSLASNDDFNSGFSVQGSGFDRVGILLDGIPVHNFLHTIQGLEDSGSTTLLSAHLLEGIDLVSSGDSSLWNSHSAGFVNMRSRSGNSSRWRNLISVSGSAFLMVSEGPMKRGNWIASARKSYVDWIVRRIDPTSDLNFGFHDFFGKVDQVIGDKHQLSLSLLHGKTSLSDVAEGSGMNSIDNGSFIGDLAHLAWNFRPTEKVAGETHLYFQRSDSSNRNPQDETLWKNRENITGLRTVWSYQLGSNISLSTGMTGEFWSAMNHQNRFEQSTKEWSTVSSFQEETSRSEIFLQTRFQLFPSLHLFGGWSWNRQGSLDDSFHSPSAGIELHPSERQMVSFSFGQSGQYPSFYQLFGDAGSPGLKAETARVIRTSWRYRDSKGFELLVSGYRRTRHDVPWRKDGYWRIVEGSITPPGTSAYENILLDRSYGAEFRLGRSSSKGLSGWVGYAWGRSRWSERPGTWFPGNYDQRHGFSAFALNRWSSEVELSLKCRLASGMPLPVFAAVQDGRYYLAEERNQERLPSYGRLDVRIAKSITKERYRITLFAEVLNFSGHTNYRFSGHDYDSVNPRTGRIHGLTQKQFPFLPTAGLTVEF